MPAFPERIANRSAVLARYEYLHWMSCLHCSALLDYYDAACLIGGDGLDSSRTVEGFSEAVVSQKGAGRPALDTGTLASFYGATGSGVLPVWHALSILRPRLRVRKVGDGDSSLVAVAP
jgi:hypothetical protein